MDEREVFAYAADIKAAAATSEVMLEEAVADQSAPIFAMRS